MENCNISWENTKHDWNKNGEMDDQVEIWFGDCCCWFGSNKVETLTCCSLRPSSHIPPETLGHLERRWRPTGHTAGHRDRHTDRQVEREIFEQLNNLKAALTLWLIWWNKGVCSDPFKFIWTLILLSPNLFHISAPCYPTRNGHWLRASGDECSTSKSFNLSEWSMLVRSKRPRSIINTWIVSKKVWKYLL